ncbi:MAG: hypothetical protein ACJAU2_000469 [Maribacter sp.]|jgi:hypothetical protein
MAGLLPICTTELKIAKLDFPEGDIVPKRLLDLYPVQLFMRWALYLLGSSFSEEMLKCFK